MERSVGIEIRDLTVFSAIFYGLSSHALCIDILFPSAFILFLLLLAHTTSFIYFVVLRQPSHLSEKLGSHLKRRGLVAASGGHS